VISTILRWQEEFDLGRPLGGSLATWTHYREVADGSWYDDPSLCPVAPIYRLGIYLIHDALALFGAAEEVHVMSSRIFTGRPTPDHARMLVRFRSGSLVDIASSFCIDDGDFYRQKSHFEFERGSIYRNAGTDLVGPNATHLSLVKRQGNQAEVVKEISLSAGNYDWEGFYRATQNVESASPDYVRRILDGLEVIDAVMRSEASGQPARIGPGHLKDIQLRG
jgi:predicted dehydrogenase